MSRNAASYAKGKGYRWRTKMLAALSMYRHLRMILLGSDERDLSRRRSSPELWHISGVRYAGDIRARNLYKKLARQKWPTSKTPLNHILIQC